MSFQPISGNQTYTRMRDTIVSGESVSVAQSNADISQAKQVVGYLANSVAGSLYAVLRADGSPIIFPIGSLITTILLESDDITAGDIQPYLALTQGGSSTQVLTAANVGFVDISKGTWETSSLTTGVVLTAQFLGATITNDVTGTVKITVVYF
jgi:hypothetical protein